MPTLTILVIIAIFVALSVLFALWIDGSALFAPRSTKRIAGSAGKFCVHECRSAEGECPLSRFGVQPEDCPLWNFVNADLPTQVHGSPFAHLKTSQ